MYYNCTGHKYVNDRRQRTIIVATASNHNSKQYCDDNSAANGSPLCVSVCVCVLRLNAFEKAISKYYALQVTVLVGTLNVAVASSKSCVCVCRLVRFCLFCFIVSFRWKSVLCAAYVRWHASARTLGQRENCCSFRITVTPSAAEWLEEYYKSNVYQLYSDQICLISFAFHSQDVHTSATSSHKDISSLGKTNGLAHIVPLGLTMWTWIFRSELNGGRSAERKIKSNARTHNAERWFFHFG